VTSRRVPTTPAIQHPRRPGAGAHRRRADPVAGRRGSPARTGTCHIRHDPSHRSTNRTEEVRNPSHTERLVVRHPPSHPTEAYHQVEQPLAKPTMAGSTGTGGRNQPEQVAEFAGMCSLGNGCQGTSACGTGRLGGRDDLRRVLLVPREVGATGVDPGPSRDQLLRHRPGTRDARHPGSRGPGSGSTTPPSSRPRCTCRTWTWAGAFAPKNHPTSNRQVPDPAPVLVVLAMAPGVASSMRSGDKHLGPSSGSWAFGWSGSHNPNTWTEIKCGDHLDGQASDPSRSWGIRDLSLFRQT